MGLTDLSVKDFTAELASSSPAPGGGSVAALSGAMGAALVAMVAALTQGRKKYEQYAAFAAEAEKRANELKDALLLAVEHDTEAYNAFSALLSMPKDTEEQRAARTAAMQEGLKKCVQPPLEILELSARACELCEALFVNGYNTGAGSDLGAAQLCLESAARGAWLNVLINISSINDEAFNGECRNKGKALLERVEAVSGRGYAAVLEMLGG